MNEFDFVLSVEERAVFKLRSLYKKYGYTQYRMSKFEEYDLYAKNKEFLVSDNVITFTDTDGKLLALKPDVTLSIIKNDKDTRRGIKKVYYDEHVYRVSKGTRSFKEILQAGLECVGDVDRYCVAEVLALAGKSLDVISENNVLDVSHLGIVKAVAEQLGIKSELLLELFSFIGDKNAEGVRSVCQKSGLNQADTSLVEKFVTLYGKPEKVEKQLNCFCISPDSTNAVKELLSVINGAKNLGLKNNIRVDFSVVNDLNYYNGVVFRGFVEGIPTGILSGGQYDNLIEKMGRKAKAIGFAVYLDEIEKLSEHVDGYDVDTFILYEKDSDLTEILNATNNLVLQGKTVLADKYIPEGKTYKNLIKITDKEAN